MEKYLRSLFFYLIRSFSYFCLVFLATCVDSLNKLPHVIKYETITPQKRYKLSQTSTEQQVCCSVVHIVFVSIHHV